MANDIAELITELEEAGVPWMAARLNDCDDAVTGDVCYRLAEELEAGKAPHAPRTEQLIEDLRYFASAYGAIYGAM